MKKGTRQGKNVLLPPLNPTHVVDHVMINPSYRQRLSFPNACVFLFSFSIKQTKIIQRIKNNLFTNTMEDNKTKKDQLQAVWFAAGMAVVIACLERAVVVSIFKQWHMWVFLALNLLLIAILFTSTYPPRNTSNPPPKSHSGQETKTHAPVHVSQAPVHAPPSTVENDRVNEGEESGDDEDDVDDDNDEKSLVLSNDELNEKVEAFISRFRQQYLVSDVKIISRTRSDNVCGSGNAVFSKTITV